MADSVLFSGKNCLVIGALHPVGRAIARRLVARGAFVVAVDNDEDGLHALSRGNPEQIAPLALDLSDTQALDRLTSNWGPEPLHALVMAHPLDPQWKIGDILRSADATTRRLAPVLEASHGAALTLFHAPGEMASPLERARADAMARLTSGLADMGARINAMALHPAALASRASGQLCATAMMMLLPMSAAIGGAVLPVGQHGMPA